jgi:hypothetical protein
MLLEGPQQVLCRRRTAMKAQSLLGPVADKCRTFEQMQSLTAALLAARDKHCVTATWMESSKS